MVRVDLLIGTECFVYRRDGHEAKVGLLQDRLLASMILGRFVKYFVCYPFGGRSAGCLFNIFVIANSPYIADDSLCVGVRHGSGRNIVAHTR